MKKMLWFIFVSVYCVLSLCCTVSGQSAAPSYAESVEGLQRRLEEHDRILKILIQNIRSLSSAVDIIKVKLDEILHHAIEDSQSTGIPDHCRHTSDVCDCSDIKANGYPASGVYRIYVVDQGKRYYANAFCDMTTTNVAWTVFQRRKDGSVDFFRGWNEYAYGFGNSSGEFWLGNNFLHILTSKRGYRLRIDLEDFEGGKRHAEYSTFSISSSADKYRLGASGYSGSAGDSLSHSNGQKFTTKDSDNDVFGTNCALYHHGAWWHRDCSYSNLNGVYLRGRYSQTAGSFNHAEGVYWYHWQGFWYSLKTTEMKISSS